MALARKHSLFDYIINYGGYCNFVSAGRRTIVFCTVRVFAIHMNFNLITYTTE